MPRNGAGVFSLVMGNPVVTHTTIATAWANPTLSDIASALTDSLSRSGLGGMTAPFKNADGTIGAPGITFTNQSDLGWWREGASVITAVAGGARLQSVTSTGVLTFVPSAMYDFAAWRALTFKTWGIRNLSGVWTINPSTSVDAFDWDTAKGFTADPSTGVFDFKQTPTVAGTVVAKISDVNTVQGNLNTHIAVTTGAHGTGTVALQNANNVALTGGSASGVSLLLAPRITPAAPPALTTGTAFDWSARPTQVTMAPGENTSSFTGHVAGEVKRIYVTGSGAVTLNVGGGNTLKWAPGSPTWGTTGTLVSLVCASSTLFLGVTVPYN